MEQSSESQRENISVYMGSTAALAAHCSRKLDLDFTTSSSPFSAQRRCCPSSLL